MSNYRYTVVIPTRNRQHYCVEAVQSVLLSNRDDVQIIVLDNSDNESLREQLAEWQDCIDYVAPVADTVLPMHHNWERAIDRIQGEWVTYIGDDDGCLPHMFDVLDFIDSHFTFDAITWNCLYYKWPCYPSTGRGELSYIPDMNINISLQLPKVELQHAAQWLTDDKYPNDGPSVYHGAVRTDLVRSARDRFGSYFYNCIPDYVSGLFNMAMTDIYARYNQPLTIGGAGKLSNTASMTGIRNESQNKDLAILYEHAAADNDYRDLPNSRLAVPYVIACYREVMGLLNIPFQITPQRVLNSCLVELKKIRDEAMFAEEQANLVAYAKQHGLAHEPIEALTVKQAKYFVGYAKQNDHIYIDTTELGIRGIVDLVKACKAFILTFEHTQSYHEIFYQRFKDALPTEYSYLLREDSGLAA